MKRLLSEKNSGYVYVQFSRKNDVSFLSIRGNELTPLIFFLKKSTLKLPQMVLLPNINFV